MISDRKLDVNWYFDKSKVENSIIQQLCETNFW